MGLGAVPIGAFDDAGVADALGLSSAEIPLYIIPVGRLPN
jgi:nitroreductase